MSVRINELDCLRRLGEVQQRALYGCLKYGEAAAMKLASDAKRNIRWTEHTRNAKNSLTGSAFTLGTSRVRVQLAHGVRYGVYLENRVFRHKGRLDIVGPTVRKLAPEIMEGWAQVVRKGGGHA